MWEIFIKRFLIQIFTSRWICIYNVFTNQTYSIIKYCIWNKFLIIALLMTTINFCSFEMFLKCTRFLSQDSIRTWQIFGLRTRFFMQHKKHKVASRVFTWLWLHLGKQRGHIYRNEYLSKNIVQKASAFSVKPR